MGLDSLLEPVEAAGLKGAIAPDWETPEEDKEDQEFLHDVLVQDVQRAASVVAQRLLSAFDDSLLFVMLEESAGSETTYPLDEESFAAAVASATPDRLKGFEWIAGGMSL